MKYKEIIAELDKWVLSCGTGKYLPNGIFEDFDIRYSLNENIGMQQNKKEISELIKVILKQKNFKNCLEIGFGYYGSTHFLWRLLFKQAITIELYRDRIFTFRDNMNKFYNKFVFDDLKSKFIFGSSNDVASVNRLIKILDGEKLDFLFIDGNHEYENVVCDWLIYRSFVRKGGIIAFHDCVPHKTYIGPSKLISNIEYFDGRFKNKIKIHKFIHSSYGIAYYLNP